MPSFRAMVNPLKCVEIEFAATPTDPMPSAEDLLKFLSAPQNELGRDAFVARYNEIVAAVPDAIPIAAAEPNILNKLVYPLRHAKGSYALANYLGCIALCGMVGEMTAILLWDIAKVPLSGKEMGIAEETALLGRKFERLSQARRAEVLSVLGLIDKDTKAAFDRLREIRNKYLHLFSQSHEQIAADARKAFQDALKAVGVVLGQTIERGAVTLRPDLATYPTEQGILTI